MFTNTVSVCVPCAAAHISFLEELCASCAAQVYPADEHIICVSGAVGSVGVGGNAVAAHLQRLAAAYPTLNLKYEIAAAPRTAGQNRNRAAQIATGDIVAFVDADDVMHESRIFIIQSVFAARPTAVAMLHKYAELTALPASVAAVTAAVDTVSTATQTPLEFDDARIWSYLFCDDLHFGHAVVRRSVFATHRYSTAPRGQDVAFVDSLLPQFRDRMVIYDAPLTYYMSCRSLFYGINVGNTS